MRAQSTASVCGGSLDLGANGQEAKDPHDQGHGKIGQEGLLVPIGLEGSGQFVNGVGELVGGGGAEFVQRDENEGSQSSKDQGTDSGDDLGGHGCHQTNHAVFD